MKLQVLGFIDETLDYFHKKKDELEEISKEISRYFSRTFENEDEFTNISSRIKSERSLKEKILRQNYFLKYRSCENLIGNMQDIIGVRLECRFIKDEGLLYKKLQNDFLFYCGSGYYHSTDNQEIQLKIEDPQPQKQHNGFEIYKIDGRYVSGDIKYHFELQIKSYVNIFWGDIDHRVLYKNYSYVVTEDFIRQMMYSIKDNLEMVDSQLMVVYDHLKNIERDEVEISKNQLKKVLSKTIHDIFVVKFKAETGIVLDYRKPVDLIVDYLFAKAYYSSDIDVSQLFVRYMHRLNQLSNKEFQFGDFINLGNVEIMKGDFCETFGKGIQSILNLDLKWNLLLTILFEIEDKPRNEEFVSFIEYIVFTISYRIRKGVKKFKLEEKLVDSISDSLTQVVFDLIFTDYNLDFFCIKNMRTIENLTVEILSEMNDIEEFNFVDRERFRKRLLEETE